MAVAEDSPFYCRHPWRQKTLKEGERPKRAVLERFNFEKGETRRRRGKTALFPRNDRLYGLKRAAFQNENALGGVAAWEVKKSPFSAFVRKVEKGAEKARRAAAGAAARLLLCFVTSR